MYHRDSPTEREEERRRYQSTVRERAVSRTFVDYGKNDNALQVEKARGADVISSPGGFRNHPDDPNNPNEVRERYLRKLRPVRVC